jgi:hypothetical protein
MLLVLTCEMRELMGWKSACRYGTGSCSLSSSSHTAVRPGGELPSSAVVTMVYTCNDRHTVAAEN